ncbi:hypothetical protein AYO29_00510 [Coxiella burnetii str. Schperling]|nr:hypothetical protein AYO29_00510 [Coxiella burnetii str. Schperling]EAX33995.1 hypothetical protein A35_00640 [Coxiella burnetii 'MSU Goat Q177']
MPFAILFRICQPPTNKTLGKSINNVIRNIFLKRNFWNLK